MQPMGMQGLRTPVLSSHGLGSQNIVSQQGQVLSGMPMSSQSISQHALHLSALQQRSQMHHMGIQQPSVYPSSNMVQVSPRHHTPSPSLTQTAPSPSTTPVLLPPGVLLGGMSTPTPMESHESNEQQRAKIFSLVSDLLNTDKREGALLELSKKRETVPDLAPILWHSFGTVAVLLQEIIAIYPLLAPPKLKAHASNRVCNALALLQCVASHKETRTLFLNANIPLYLYPFLNTSSKTRPFEYLRLTSLGVIGALVKMDDPEVIGFLLSTEIIPLCLRIMETGSELSKTVATFVIQKILLDDLGLDYICATYDRFNAVTSVLNSMIAALMEQPSQRLLKHIIRCYLRLSDNARAREALRPMLPEPFRDGSIGLLLSDDTATKQWLARLIMQLNEPAV